MGPLAAIYSRLLEDALRRRFPDGPGPRPHQGLLEDRPMPPGLGPRPFRDPMQEGPSPPITSPLAAMFGGPRG